jgi:sec-independent protein translocase protein TatB
VFLFIFESIGTQELLLIGIVALIFLGPRRMPEMARKLGKLMSDFRNTTSEFKATWEREVNFEEEARHLRKLTDLDEPEPIARANSILAKADESQVVLPEIRAVDPADFEKAHESSVDTQTIETKQLPDLNAKENWL